MKKKYFLIFTLYFFFIQIFFPTISYAQLEPPEISSPSATPQAFSPNDDGVQETTEINFELTDSDSETLDLMVEIQGSDLENADYCRMLYDSTKLLFPDPQVAPGTQGFVWDGLAYLENPCWEPLTDLVSAPEGFYNYSITALDMEAGADFYNNQIPLPGDEESPDILLDITPPITDLLTPVSDSFWNSAIPISGDSTDNYTVDQVELFSSPATESSWQSIEILYTPADLQTYNWSYDWTPATNGIYDLMTRASDTAGNQEDTASVQNITYDTTPPSVSWLSPGNGDVVTGTTLLKVAATDDLAGVEKVKFEYQKDDGIDTFHELLIDTDATDGWEFDWDTSAQDLGCYLLRATGFDFASNWFQTTIAVGIGAIISGVDSDAAFHDKAIITWKTDHPATSQVRYALDSHSGYAYSTAVYNQTTPTTNHRVEIQGLSAGTTYYYQVIAGGPPTTLSSQYSFQTLTYASTTESDSENTAVGGPEIATAQTPSAPMTLGVWGTAEAAGVGQGTEGEAEEVLGETAAEDLEGLKGLERVEYLKWLELGLIFGVFAFLLFWLLKSKAIAKKGSGR